MAQFFVSCPLGFEQELVQEMREFWFELVDLDGLPTRHQLAEPEIHQGGVQIEVPEHIGYQIGFFTKTANRVLIRIGRFDARYFDQFEKGLEKIKWTDWFEEADLQKGLHVKIESHKSRLNNEKNMTEALQNVWNKQKIKLNEKSQFTVFIRIDKDRVTVSLDTSGEHLHRRGYALYRGEAPLRETLAAALIRQVFHYAGAQAQINLVDPFCGSGTLLFEALSARQPLLSRTYAWQSFKNRPKLFKSETWMKNYRWLPKEVRIAAFGIDQDESVLEALKKNIRLFSDMFTAKTPLDDIIRTQQADCSKIDLNHLPGFTRAGRTTWAVANPPYGLRLDDQSALQGLRNIEKQVDGMVVIHPENWKMGFTKLQLVKEAPFSNQGLKLKLSVFCHK